MVTLNKKSFLVLIFLLVFGAVKSLADPDLRQITSDQANDYHVKWSPDGSQIAFASTRAGNMDIWVKDISLNVCDDSRRLYLGWGSLFGRMVQDFSNYLLPCKGQEKCMSKPRNDGENGWEIWAGHILGQIS